MQTKKLTEEDIELLERQGLIADIRNNLGPMTSLLFLLEILRAPDDATPKQKREKDFAQSMLESSAAESQRNLEHILDTLKYIEDQPTDKHGILLIGTH